LAIEDSPFAAARFQGNESEWRRCRIDCYTRGVEKVWKKGTSLIIALAKLRNQ
jgi:hypothetical protein